MGALYSTFLDIGYGLLRDTELLFLSSSAEPFVSSTSHVIIINAQPNACLIGGET
jgi:hypothetical protein